MKPDQIANNPRASELWDYYQGKLAADGKWKDIYAAQFSVFIDALANFVETCARLAALETDSEIPHGLMMNPAKGTLYRHPLLDVKAQYVNTIRVFGAAFGLNPLADARLKQGPMEAVGELLKLMGGVNQEP